jgi:hypothetical protein
MGDGFTMVEMGYRRNVAAVALALGVASGCGSESKDFITGSNTIEGDEFGEYIALSADGQTLAVGATQEQSSATGINGNQADNSLGQAGAVYVFARAGDSWRQQAYVKASNTGAGDAFGLSVALSADGSTLVVGAPFEDSSATGINGDQTDNSDGSKGAAYVYVRVNDSWAQEAYIKGSTTASSYFGTYVALSADGSTLAVWAGDYATAADVDGAVYVFTRSGGTWSQQAQLRLSQAAGHGDLLGSTVALSADGSTLAARGGRVDSAVYIYSRAGDTWSEPAQVSASNAAKNNVFGSAIAISSDGSVLAVGAPLESSMARGIDGDQTQNTVDPHQSGAVYVYGRDQGTWSQQAYVKASDSDGAWFFGSAVAITSDGSTVTVGAPGARGRGSAGSVYAYTRAGTTWLERALVHRGERPLFGTAVASSSDGSTVAIGTVYDAVWVYLGGLATSR